MVDILKKYHLPRRVIARVKRIKNNFLLAEFPELLGASTQAKNWQELDQNVNEIILAYFDVPSRYANKIFYRRRLFAKKKSTPKVTTISRRESFNLFVTPSFA